VSSDPPTSPSGREILAWEYDSPGSKSVRARRDIMAHALDTVADERPKPNVLAVACGHLREIALSSAAQRRAFNWFIGIDQDGDSLAEVDRCYGKYGISTIPATIQGLISQRRTLPTFDLIYASGLYDYLPDRTAQTLTSVLFGMLGKRGRLLIGNFAPEMRDIGYMEAVMDWRLLYRTEVDMLGLTALIDPGQIGTIRTFREPHKNIVFLDVERA
jgi:extracellular factor (EF) 3-hydroxypalmitic acid methyl ester biosynthesis protein